MEINQKTIEKTLIQLGTPTNVKGYNYLVMALQLLAENPSQKIVVELYPALAEKMNVKNTGSIEKCIRYAISRIWAQQSELYYNIFYTKQKVSVSRFLTGILIYLRTC